MNFPKRKRETVFPFTCRNLLQFEMAAFVYGKGSALTIPPHIRSVVDHDGAIILDINEDQFFSVNPIGTYIWTHLLNGERLDQIAISLAEETGMDLSIVLADVNDFVSELKDKHLFQFHD